MDQTEFDLLVRIERGGHVFRPNEGSPESREEFQTVVDLLLHLRAIGLIRLPDGRVMRGENGAVLMVGPCDLTPAGIAALSRDRSLGERALGRPQENGP